MRILVSGGCKNGKSSLAEDWISRVADRSRPLYYLATMLPKDEEDRLRIEKHRLSRQGIPFTTIEVARDIDHGTAGCDPDGFFLLDSTTALLDNEMFGTNGQVDWDAGQRIINDLAQLLDRIEHLVIVSDYIYSDAFHYDELTEHFRRSLAQIDQSLAARCDVVLEVSFGQLIFHKGAHLMGEYLKLRESISQGDAP